MAAASGTIPGGELSELTHLDDTGAARMVDVSQKDVTDRSATADGSIRMQPETLEAIRSGAVAKGDVLAVARIAGIMGAKRTAELVPLCHPLPLNAVEVLLKLDSSLPGVRVAATVRTAARTGVEMEALTGVMLALVTIYDMVKGLDRTMVISDIRVVEKKGGRSG